MNWIACSGKETPMMPLADFFDLIHTWTSRGWLRPLDQAFVTFLSRQDPSATSPVLLGAALASHQLGRGHICLDLDSALADPDTTLSLPPEGRPEKICLQNLPRSFVISPGRPGWIIFPDPRLCGNDKTPLVLKEGRLYLRRYWQYTRQVAREIISRAGQTAQVPEDLDNRLDELFKALRSPEERINKPSIGRVWLRPWRPDHFSA